MRIEHRTSIDAPPSRVWELTLDVESWPDQTPTVTSVERLDSGPIGVGSRALVKQPAQRAKTWTVTAVDLERRFAWSTKWLGMSTTGTHELEPSSSGTTSTLSIDIEGPVAAIAGPLLRRPIEKALTKENQGLKTAAER